MTLKIFTPNDSYKTIKLTNTLTFLEAKLQILEKYEIGPQTPDFRILCNDSIPPESAKITAFDGKMTIRRVIFSQLEGEEYDEISLQEVELRARQLEASSSVQLLTGYRFDLKLCRVNDEIVDGDVIVYLGNDGMLQLVEGQENLVLWENIRGIQLIRKNLLLLRVGDDQFQFFCGQGDEFLQVARELMKREVIRRLE